MAYFVLFPAAKLHAASFSAEQWEITADKITRMEDPPRMIAEGDVLLEKKRTETREQTTKSSGWEDLLGKQLEPNGGESVTEVRTLTAIKADWVAYDLSQGQAEARGNLFIAIGGDQLKAERGRIFLKEATGVFEQAAIIRQEQALHLEGRVIEKTGELTYHIEDGWIITCKLDEGESPPWSFAAADAEITDGGYALLKHATFRIKDVPVFYAPYLILPAKHTRQTGFLFPSFYLSSRDGFSVETPFFINLSPNADLSLYPRYMAKRGFMGGIEFRYAANNEGKGLFRSHALLNDALSDASEQSYRNSGGFYHTNEDRYWLRGKADQNIDRWVARMDIDLVSDRDYLREFHSGSTSFHANNEQFLQTFGRGFQHKLSPYRNNTVDLLHSWEDGSMLLAQLMAVNDVSDQLYAADQPSPLWKAPQLTYAGLTPFWGRDVNLSWDASYAHYWREKGVRGHRIDFSPELSASLPLSPYLESTLRAGVRDTFYRIDGNEASAWNGEENKNRFLYTIGAELSSTLERSYAVDFIGKHGLSHTLRPFVGYEYLDIPNKVSLPHFDALDQLKESNILYYGLNNFFTLFDPQQDSSASEREYAFLKIKQGYDLRQEHQEHPFTPLEIKTGIYPLPSMRLVYTGKLDVYGEGAVLHALELDYLSNQGNSLSLDYRYNAPMDIHSVSGGLWYWLPYHFAAGYSLERAIESGVTVEEKIHLLYKPACWSVELTSSYTPGDRSIMLTFNLANIGNPLGFNLEGM